MSGCAKTTTAMKLIVNKPLSEWICVAFTHSAVNNLKDIYLRLKSELNPKESKPVSHQFEREIISTESSVLVRCHGETKLSDNFMTIHRFLKIPVSVDKDRFYTIVKHKKLPYLASLIIVDEFSLIPLDIIEYLFELSETSGMNFVFVGDFVQLMPISEIKEPISLRLLHSDFSNINLSFNEAIRIADHLSNSVYTSKYFESSDKMILLHNYRNGDKVHQVLNDALDYKFNKAMGAKYDSVVSLSEIPKCVNDGYIILSSMYSLLARAYLYTNPVVREGDVLKNTRIGKVKFNVGDRLVLLENLDSEFVNGDEVVVKSVDGIKDEMFHENVEQSLGNEIEIMKVNEKLDESERKCGNSRIVDANKVLPYNFITCHKAQGRTIPKVLLILDDLFEITMLYTAITRASEDIKFIKFDHWPSKTDINAFKIMRDVIYKLPSKGKNEGEKVMENVKGRKQRKQMNLKIDENTNIDFSSVNFEIN